MSCKDQDLTRVIDVKHSMADTREPRSVIEAAEHAAAAGDYSSAERLLREAAVLQEASLGPLNPDLANTLNNLGVACELADKPADAELCYRRAYAIATAVLEPDHPFVATSRKNLTDFCEARGIVVEPHAPVADAEPGPPATRPVDTPLKVPTSVNPRVPASRRSPGPLALGVAIAMALVLFIAIRSCGSTEKPGSSSETPSSTQAAPSAAETPPVEPSRAPAETATNGRGPVKPPAAAESRAAATSTPAGSLLVVEASLCKNSPGSRRLPSDWHCDAPSLPVSQGPLVFYTRLKSPRDTTVEHRWFRDERLQQKMELRIGANQNSGYRTFSRATVFNSSGGWRVELRTKDGILLHEQRFDVR